MPADFGSEGALSGHRSAVWRWILGELLPSDRNRNVATVWWSCRGRLVIPLVIPPAITRQVRSALDGRAADLSSQDRPGWHLLDECVSTRNRKVVGSDPTSAPKPQVNVGSR